MSRLVLAKKLKDGSYEIIGGIADIKGEIMSNPNEMTIWKFQVTQSMMDVDGTTKLHMPKGAMILTTDIQNDVICIWAKVDKTKDLEERTFRIVGTGHVIPARTEAKFIGTVFMLDKTLVFHIFEVIWQLTESHSHYGVI